MPAATHEFPVDFVWGTATSAYQIEGAYQDDGKGESIWDRFTHTPGKIANDDTGDVACDHYHRWREDVQLMASLGCRGYRFSVSWPRIFPTGYGKVNPAGLDFYSRLVDELLAAGITPYLTLYHWDLPQALQEQGGWPARSTASAYCEYAEALVRRLGDRVTHWMTLNEPFISAQLGYGTGVHAPGHTDPAEALAAAHHLLLAHGWAVPILRRDCPGGQVGTVLNLGPQTPASAGEVDEQAARLADGQVNRWYLDPLAGRGYPRDVVEQLALALPFDQPGDQATIATPVDFLGINYYTRSIVRSQAIPEWRNRPRDVRPGEVTDMGWEIYPDGLYELLLRLKDEYAFPAYYVTENGAAFADEVGPEGQVDDARRIDYLAGHIDAAGRAMAAGAPLRGYFVWSLMDNFEWNSGYGKRFGLVHVDFATLKRTPKASAGWYRETIARNGL